MNFYSLDQIVAVARTCSPFYRQLYSKFTLDKFQLEDLPVVRFDAVMHAVHNDYKALFTSDDAYGMCYTTSGTTGHPKATLFGRDEWETVNRMLSSMHWRNGTIRSGDIVCSISEPGSASFMAIHRVIAAFPGRCSEIPLGCDTTYDRVVATYRQFKANVIAGMNPTLLGLAAYVLTHGGPDPYIERLLGGGELLIGAQADLIQEAFPNAQICSFMYGAAETGLIGYSEFGLRQNQFRPFSDICKLEILDSSTLKPIFEPGIIGIVVVTSFVRISTPVIRFMTGDYAQWDISSDTDNPLFSLHGRIFPFVHDLGGSSISNEDIYRIVSILNNRLRILGFQLVISEESKQTKLDAYVWLHHQVITDSELTNVISDALYEYYPLLNQGETKRLQIIITAKLVDNDYFEPSSRRKSKYIIDKRLR